MTAATVPAREGVHEQITVIESGARRGLWSLAHEVVERRDLLFFLVIRDIKARYAQTVLGLSWAVIQPLATMGVFSVFFGAVTDIPSEGVPYPVFSLAALVPWTYFANSATIGSMSLVSNISLLTKVYVPRLVLPLAAVIGGLVNLGVSFVVLVGVMLAFGYVPDPVAIIWIPILTLLAVLAALAVSVLLAPLTVTFRDIRYTAPFLVQLWLFATPVIYPLDLVPENARLLYSLNPMTGVVDGFRSALLDGDVYLPAVALSAAVSSLLLLAGLAYFRAVERRFADVA